MLAVLFDAAVAKPDDAPGPSGNLFFVGDENDGVAGFGEGCEHVHDVVAGRGVEVAGGFVGQNDGGTVDKGPGYGDALDLTAGEFGWFVVDAIAEPDLTEQGNGAFLSFFRVNTGVDEWQLDVAKAVEPGQKVEVLKDEAYFAVADAGEFVVVHVGDVFSFEEVGAAGRGVEAAENVHEGRFAAA